MPPILDGFRQPERYSQQAGPFRLPPSAVGSKAEPDGIHPRWPVQSSSLCSRHSAIILNLASGAPGGKRVHRAGGSGRLGAVPREPEPGRRATAGPPRGPRPAPPPGPRTFMNSSLSKHSASGPVGRLIPRLSILPTPQHRVRPDCAGGRGGPPLRVAHFRQYGGAAGGCTRPAPRAARSNGRFRAVLSPAAEDGTAASRSPGKAPPLRQVRPAAAGLQLNRLDPALRRGVHPAGARVHPSYSQVACGRAREPLSATGKAGVRTSSPRRGAAHSGLPEELHSDSGAPRLPSP